MIAIIAGFLLVSYLLGPGAIYRLAFSFHLSSKRLQRTRAEEIVFSVTIIIVPLFFASLLLLHTELGHVPTFSGPIDKRDSYRLVLSSLVSDSAAKSTLLVAAYYRAFAEQCRLVLFLWILCGIEGYYLGRFVSKYGSYKTDSWQRTACDRFLLKQVSEWQFLFTTLSLAPEEAEAKVVEVDVISSGTLYRGRLVNWFSDLDGKLAGIFIEDCARYRKDALDRDRKENINRPTDEYWKPIGDQMYIPASTIANYNIRYVLKSENDILLEELGPDVVLEPLGLPAPEPDDIPPASPIYS